MAPSLKKPVEGNDVMSENISASQAETLDCRKRIATNVENIQTNFGSKSKDLSDEHTDTLPRCCDANDICLKCKTLNADEIKLKSDRKIYYKKKEDSIVKDSSIRTVLFDLSPRWLQSFLIDPEYVITNNKKSKSSTDVHKQADSLFSTSSGFNNYRGLLNLCIILLALSNARLFLENIIKYGILIDPILWVRMCMNQPFSAVNIGLILGSNVFILIMYYTEKAMSKAMFSERFALLIQSVTLVSLITIPATVILILDPNPLLSTTVLGIYTVLFLKLISYASVNKWCRQSQSPTRHRIRRTKSVSVSEGSLVNGKEETMIIQYPENLNFNNLYYFMFAPTLCYELNFPRTLRIRKRFLLKRIVEMLFVVQLIAACIQQWILPLMHNSMKPLEDLDAARVVERLLKLAIPNHFIWLMFFYWFFHSTLNVIAELLTFGDREFYKDWWNSESVNQFWSNWNIPVHRWAHRHLYKPLLRRGHSKLTASVAVFFLSAFFHEYLVSVPLHMFKLWAFMGMLGQVPLAMVQMKYINWKYGNMVVWLSLILGQPIAILAYYHDFYINHMVAAATANQTVTP
ncbi:Diacylglycerol O-acyltransferase 1 [Mactra antiquata]